MKIFQGMLRTLYILSEEKNLLFLVEGGRPPPLVGDMSKKNNFWRPPLHSSTECLA